MKTKTQAQSSEAEGGAVERCLALIDDLQDSMQSAERSALSPSTDGTGGTRAFAKPPAVGARTNSKAEAEAKYTNASRPQGARASPLSQKLRKQAYQAINSSDDEDDAGIEKASQGPQRVHSSRGGSRGQAKSGDRKDTSIDQLKSGRAGHKPKGGTALQTDQTASAGVHVSGQDEYRLLQKKYSLLKTKCQELESALSVTAQQNHDMDTQIKTYEAKEQETKKQVEHLIDRTADLQKQVESMDHVRESERMAIQSMNIHNMSAGTQVATLMSQITSLRTQLQASNSKVFSLEAALILSQQTADLSRTQGSGDQLLRPSQASQTQAEAPHEVLSSRLKELEAQLDKAMMVEVDLQAQVKGLKNMYQEATDQVAHIKVQSGVDKLRQDLNEVTHSNEIKDLELKKAGELVLVLRRAIKGWEEKFSQHRTAGNAEQQRLLQEIKLLKEQQRSLAMKNQELKGALDESKKDYMSLMDQLVQSGSREDLQDAGPTSDVACTEQTVDQVKDAELRRLSEESQVQMDAFRKDHQHFKVQVSNLISSKSRSS